MLTGQMPFPGEYDSVLFHAILNNEPESIADKRHDVPVEIEHITYKCLQKDKEHRYQSAGHLLPDLKKLRKDIESGKRAAQAEQPPVKTRKRMPKSVLIAATLVLATAFLIIGYNLFQQAGGEPRVIQTRLLTPTSAIIETEPALSPDGTRIAYSSNESGNNDIWVQQIATGHKINLTKDYEGDDGMSAWSADGDWIAFSSERNDGGIFVMSALGGPARQVTTARGRASWSPDGTKLVYSTGFTKMYVVALSGGAAVHVPLPHSARAPTWSPDGSRIAYSADALKKICTIGPDGSDLIVVIEGSGGYWSPIWAQDGKSIFFKSGRGGIRDIWWIPVDQKGKAIGPARSVTIGGGVYNFSLSQDDSKIAYMKSAGSQDNIWSIPISSDRELTMQDAHRITSQNRAGRPVHLAISPDHEWLAFHSNRSGNQDIWLMRKDGRDLRQLTTDKADDSWPTWSPDGSRIAFHSDRSGNSDIYLMPVRGGFATALTHDAASDVCPVWSPVGDDIVFVSKRSGNWDNWVVSVNSGDLRQLTTHEAVDGRPAWSPDGRDISFLSRRTGTGELFVFPVDGGEPVQLTDFGLTSSFGEYAGAWDARSVWSLDGKTIYITYELEPEDPGRDIWTISVEDGSMRKVLDFKRGGLYGFLTGVLANDGDRLYFSEETFTSDIWMAELEYE
jgi:Tol biopolymer transport system component